MTLMQRVKRFLGFAPVKRAYDGAAVSRLTANWTTQNYSADHELWQQLRVLRARCRELEQNNDYVSRYLALLDQNVIGPSGIELECRLKTQDGMTFKRSTNEAIEEAFEAWGKRGVCDVTGQLCWSDVQRIVLRSMARDGEVLIRLVRNFDNPFLFAVQVLEADYLDLAYNVAQLPNGNNIRMGVERNEWGRPVAYHLFRQHPGDWTSAQTQQRRERVSAGDIIHCYVVKRAGQSRGVPWMAPAMRRLSMLGGYEEAELIAARVGACKGGFYTSPTGEEYTGDDVDSQGNLIEAIEPGTFAQLPEGVTFTPYDPQHPTTSFGIFVKSILRGISSGLNCSYNTLASDLEGVNYSSIRQGVLDDRDNFRVTQQLMIEQLCEPVLKAWIDYAILSGQLDLPSFDSARVVAACEWQARGWQWVDPLKDMEADTAAINAGLKTRTQCLAERGLDIEDVFSQLAQEQELAAEYGLSFDVKKPDVTQMDAGTPSSNNTDAISQPQVTNVDTESSDTLSNA
jgi:lambda family phage portal protein